MRKYHISDMIGGWFVGAFTPVVLHSKYCEVAIKRYEAGDVEARHFHAVATEVTVIVEGEVRFNDQRFTSGDVIVVEPGESVSFTAESDSVTVVVKTPSCINDKFLEE